MGWASKLVGDIKSLTFGISDFSLNETGAIFAVFLHYATALNSRSIDVFHTSVW